MLNLLRRIKSPGPDRIHPRTLWEAKDIAGSLADIYELSLHTDDESEVSSVVNVVPLFKGGKEKPGNYRSVRLTFVVGKLLESILSYNNIVRLITQRQHGFVHGRSYLTNVIRVFLKK